MFRDCGQRIGNRPLAEIEIFCTKLRARTRLVKRMPWASAIWSVLRTYTPFRFQDRHPNIPFALGHRIP